MVTTCWTKREGTGDPPGSSSTAGVNLSQPPSRLRNLMIKYVPVHRYRNLDFYKTSLLKAVYIHWVLFEPRIYCLSLVLKLMVIVLNADSGVSAKIIKKFKASPKNIHFFKIKSMMKRSEGRAFYCSQETKRIFLF